MSSIARSKDIVAALSAHYPKFSKVQVCMIRNPEYGIRLTAKGERILKEKNIILTPQKHKGAKRDQKQMPQRKRVSLRLSNADYEKLKESAKETGCKSIQEYLEMVIKSKEENK
jgi:predicted DNA binding CopG/RHH family protein